jgi:archaemetzincin
VTVIALATAGPVDGEAAAYVEVCIGAAFGIEPRRLAPFPDPSYAWDASRAQFSSTLILHDALRRVPPDAAKLIVLTEHDLFIPMLSFVFGQAQLDGKAAIVSLARLRQEFYDLPPNRPLLLVRLRKEALHELGHAFGLTHCADRLCTMSLSTSIQQLDAKGSDFCESCAVLIHDATGVVAAGRDDQGG